METFDRRRLLGGILCGAVAVSGLALTSGPRAAIPSTSASQPTRMT